MMDVCVRTGAVAIVSTLAGLAHAGGVATSVIGYDPGSNAAAGYTDAQAALGGPERFTGEGVFPGEVTPFNAAFGSDEIVSIGSGGSLTLGMGGAITDDASHAFGIDLIVFGNAGFLDTSYFDADPSNDGTGVLGDTPGLFGVGGAATVQVSADGSDWVTAAVTTIDLFPTLGYDAGGEPTDAFGAMDPSLVLGDLAGLSYADLIALYDGRAGGVGIDIASTGLASAGYVRFLNESGEAFEIDAVVAVPTPAGVLGLAGLGVFAASRRRR